MAKRKDPTPRDKRVTNMPVGPGKTIARGELSFTPGDIPSVSGGKSPAMDFTHALMQGNPVAEKILRDKIDKDEASLADKFVASTYDWAKAFKFNAKETKKVMPGIMAYRSAMRQAHRFVLDNQFVEHATVIASTTPAEKLLYRLQFATLPYEKTWIEFDLTTKVRVMRAVHGLEGVPEGVADRMGVLLERVDNTMATVTMVCEGLYQNTNAPNLTCPNFTGYLYCLDERVLRFDRIYNGLTPFDMAYRLRRLKELNFPDLGVEDAEAEEIMHHVSHGTMWGYTDKGGSGVITSPRDLINNIRVPSFLARHGELAFTRFYDIFEIAQKTGPHNPTLARLINGEITEFSGMMRWIVCVLAMLNEIPVTSELIKPMHTMRAGLTLRLPAFDYHRLTLRLPKTKPIPWIQRHLSNVERKHKAHEVREHWRTYLAANPCKREEHQWEYDYNEGYRLCGKCMSFSRLIHEHVRGDPNLGWVRKEYLIKPTKQE